jgi:thiosulfate/3-mercaptopyruvate sulfurtransferase
MLVRTSWSLVPVSSMAELPLLVDPQWLQERIECSAVRVIDGSWYLPDAGRDPRSEFASGHVPDAVQLDLSSDLADTHAPIRNTVATPQALAARFAAAGIGREHPVVAYDRLGGYSAGRIWWCLRYAGHDRVAVLDGGFQRWIDEGRPVEKTTTRHAPAAFDARPEPRWLAGKRDVLAAIGDPDVVIVDVRAPDRFRGDGPESAPRRGHIPGSLNVPYSAHWTPEPRRFLDPQALRAVYRNAGIDLERRIITTCGSGVTASLAAFALTTLGHSRVSVYDGSWAEWSADPQLPLELGAARR